MKISHGVVALTLVVSAVGAQAQQAAPAPQPGQGQPRQAPPPESRGMAPGGRRMAPTRSGPAEGPMPSAPGPMMRGPISGGGIASMLLAHSAELKLTDAQLSRLAAIARRTDDRHKAERATMDSLMRANRPADGTAPNPRPLTGDQGRAMMTRMHDQERTDLRDALAVLTVDQQADAWMMRGAGPMGGMGGAMPAGARFGGVRSRRGE